MRCLSAIAICAAGLLLIVRMPTAMAQAQSRIPVTKSAGVIVMDAETGAELYGKMPDEVRPIASTTKIFVAMVARRKGMDLDAYTEIVRLDAKAARGGARTRLDIGLQYRNRDLLRAMLMASDNRAPTAVGRGAGLTPEELVEEMNKLAKKLGLKKTKFTDTSGLHGNVSTPREMALALREALQDDVLAEIMRDESVEVIAKGGHYKITYGTTNAPLVIKRFNVLGGKTGFTDAAGYCFVNAAKIKDRVVLFALYDSKEKDERFADFSRLAAWVENGAVGSSVSLQESSESVAQGRRDRAKIEVKASGQTPKAQK
jgi:serine-type D-Ala-D-Ala endopeptidase (penicillin-binding protein 7)